MNSDRRNFIKQLTVFSFILGVDPVAVLSANKIKLTKKVLNIVANSQKNFQEGMRAVYNLKTAKEMEDKTLIEQNRLALNFAGQLLQNPSILENAGNGLSLSKNHSHKKTMDAMFDSRINEYSKLAEPIEDLVPVLVTPLKENPKIAEATDAIGAGYLTLKSAIQFSSCAAASLGVIFFRNPKLIKTAVPICLEFFASSVETVEQFQRLEGTMQRNRANLQNSSVSAISQMDKYLSSKDFTIEIPQFNFKVGNLSIEIKDFASPSNDENQIKLNKLIEDRLAKGVDFPIKQEMEDFFSSFQDSLGNLLNESIQRTNEIETEQNQRQELIKEQEKNLLYSSIGQLLGTVASKTMGEKESQLFNALMPIGMQLAVAGTLGPMGWAAIGVTVANTLYAGSQPNPNVAIFKALAQIQKQLNFIIKGIEQIQKTQLDILNGVKAVFEEIQNLKKIQTQMFDIVLTDIRRVYQRLDDKELETYNDQYLIRTNRLINIIAKNVTGYTGEKSLFNTLDDSVNMIVEELNNKIFTRHAKRGFEVSELKRDVYYQYDTTPVLISLYDSIGIISALARYSPNLSTNVANDLRVSHPKLFYKLTGEIVDWLGMSKEKIETDSKKVFCQTLLTSAISSKQNINECCNEPIIEKKIADYSRTMDNALIEFRKIFIEKHIDEFESKSNYKKYCRLNSVGKNYINGENTTFGFDKSALTQPNRHLEFRNFWWGERLDNPLLNLMNDLGVLTGSKNLSNSPNKPQRKNSFKFRNGGKMSIRGTVLGSKTYSIALKFPKSKINEKYSQFPEVSLTYSILLVADEANESCGEEWVHEMQGLQIVNSRKVFICNYLVQTASASDGVKEIDWKTPVRQKLKEANISFEAIFPNSASMDAYDFFNFLIDKWFSDKKLEFVTESLNKLDKKIYEKIDGCGISLMVLSKLNQVVTSDYLVPYNIDYDDEIFTQEDFKGALEYYATQSYEEYSIYNRATKNRDKNLFQEILKEYEETKKNPPLNKKESIFYLINESETPLDPNLFVDFMCILMKRRILNTVASCKSKIRDIKENDCEPYLADTINMLRLFQDEYLNAQV